MKSVSAHKPALTLATIIAAGFLCVGCSESLPPPNTSPLTDAEKQAPIFAVAHAGDYIVVANSNGIFRANIATKQWGRVQQSRKLPAYGQFTTSQADSNSVFFCAGSGNGFYATQDAGATWGLVSQKYDFQFIYQHRDGRIYAIVEKTFTPSLNESAPITTTDKSGNTHHVRSGVIVSDNDGRSWRDISANIGTGMMLNSIFPDPTTPNRVCLRGSGIRGYVLQATDDKYTKWNSTVEWLWRKDEKTETDFLSGNFFTTTVLYELCANITNYFDHPFGESSRLPAFEIELKTNNLEFSSKEKVQVLVTVNFLRTTETVKLPDATNTEEFWRIQCVCPDGKRVAAAGRTNRVDQTKDSEKLKQRIGDDAGFQVMELSSTNSYSRLIALDKLTDFSKPGTYRIRLSYDSTGWGWEDKKHSGIWGGRFSSPIFTLTIKP